MIYSKSKKSGQRGATLVEFAVGATVFLTAMFAVIEFGRALWTHNALSDAARRAARYAIYQPASTPPGIKTTTSPPDTDVGPSITAIKNVAVYGDPAGGTQPLIPDLTPANVKVNYQQFGLGEGTVSVKIENYQFHFVLPMLPATITMPNYQTTLTAESAGVPPGP